MERRRLKYKYSKESYCTLTLTPRGNFYVHFRIKDYHCKIQYKQVVRKWLKEFRIHDVMVIGEQPENYDSSDAYYSVASTVISEIQKHIKDAYQLFFDCAYASEAELWRCLVDMIKYALEFSVTRT